MIEPAGQADFASNQPALCTLHLDINDGTAYGGAFAKRIFSGRQKEAKRISAIWQSCISGSI
jgi:hypothetical protein